MTRQQATDLAKRLARRTGAAQYVIYTGDDPAGGPYAVADDEDLDTFYSGTSDAHIVFCSSDANAAVAEGRAFGKFLAERDSPKPLLPR